ncbi:MAG: translation initiation factor IF-2 subunit beta [Candidatus Hydrothermarchaeales archaeon]
MEQDYETLLDKAYSELPDVLKEKVRFKIPEVASIVQGRVTAITNLGDMAKQLNRDASMLAKYFISELGTGGEYDSHRLTMKGAFRPVQLQEKFESFVSQYVLCPECGRPDTKILHERRIHFIKCEACGSRHPIGKLKTVTTKTGKEEPKIGEEITVEITKTGRKGDGMARLGAYLIFVKGAREGQRAKVKITGMQGNMLFADLVTVL